MEFTIPNVILYLICGLIGSIVGVIATIGVYWFSICRTAKQNLRALLLPLSPVEFATYGDTTDNRALYRQSFRDVWSAVLTYRETLPIFCRSKLDRAWTQYKGHNENMTKLGEFQAFVAPSNDEQFHIRVKALFDAIS